MAAQKKLVVPQERSTFSLALERVTAKPSRGRVSVARDQQLDAPLSKAEENFTKSFLDLLSGPKGSIERLAFETDPSQRNEYRQVYRAKVRSVPDSILKRIAIQDDLVAAIVRAREMQVGSFGRPRPDRFSTGFVIEPRPGVLEKMSPEQTKELHERIEKAQAAMNTCGATDGLRQKDQMSFSTYLQLSTRNAVVVGRIATELVNRANMGSDVRTFHHFRPIDAGTIYHATVQQTAAESVRKQAAHLLEQMSKPAGERDRKVEQKPAEGEFTWVQVIDGRPLQVFTDEELAVCNFYPVLDVEMQGYPVTPLDTVFTAVTTHLNITAHNKMYFQTGRASRGMLVFQSDDVDEDALARIKQQFQASINSVQNAWRMPVFSVGSNDKITWQPIDNSSRDAEFQYLTDQNARTILSAFQMSPDELPGWSYLSRGTNSQALSEGNNEFRIEAARDLGIRPLLAKMEEFINAVLFPLIDSFVAKLCRFKLTGLDADTEEKESIRLQQDMPVHGTYNYVMGKVEKPPVAKEMGGDFPLNPQYQAILDKYLPVGVIVERFFGVPNASKDPNLQYFRDPFWFQFQQLQQAQQQMQAQAQQQQAQPPAQGQGGDQQGQPAGDEEKQGGDQDKDLSRSVDQALELLTKSEADLPRSKRRLLAMQRKTVEHFRLGLEQEVREATKAILSVAERHQKKN